MASRAVNGCHSSGVTARYLVRPFILGQDVGTAMRDRLDQALFAQDLNGPPCGIAGHAEQVHEVLLAG